MKLYLLLLSILGVWRVTHLLAAEDGPFLVIVRVRKKAGSGFWGSLLDCFYCLSLWVAALFALALGESWRERLLLWPALSGAAILINRCINHADPEPVSFSEAPLTYLEENHELLWQSQITGPISSNVTH